MVKKQRIKNEIKRSELLSVAISPVEQEMIETMASKSGRTKSELVREIIRKEYERRKNE